MTFIAIGRNTIAASLIYNHITHAYHSQNKTQKWPILHICVSFDKACWMPFSVKKKKDGRKVENISTEAGIEVQKATFTNWINDKIKHSDHLVEDLSKDLEDGLILICLLEKLSRKTITAKYVTLVYNNCACKLKSSLEWLPCMNRVCEVPYKINQTSQVLLIIIVQLLN